MASTVTIYVHNEDHETIVNDYELESAYDEMLNDVYGVVNVAGYEYEAARVLKEIDPTAYRCGFIDWSDSEYVELEMPIELYYSDDDDAKYEWVNENV